MTKDKAVQVLKELNEVLRKHDVYMYDDLKYGVCLEDGYLNDSICSSVQYPDDATGKWQDLEFS